MPTEGLIRLVMHLWRSKKDTAEIAKIMRVPEGVVYSALVVGRERARVNA
jgi:DNA-directed RNA polymerase specialized sigma24 family protein